MFGNVFVSFIVPVYNVELYLRECVESIRKQQGCWELILIDDGSSDTCPIICDEYAEKDYRIKVIHKQNGGVSSARNAGLNVAQGDWIWFVDADDYLEDNILDSLANTIKKHPKCDLVQFGLIYLYDDGRMERKSIKSIFDLPKDDFLLQYPSFHNVRILFKKKNIIIGDFSFTKGIRMAEDQEFQLKYMMMCSHPIQVGIVPYVYRIREGSVTHETSTCKNALHDTFIVLRNLYTFIIEHNIKQATWLDWRLYRLITAALVAASKIKGLDRNVTRAELGKITDLYHSIGYKCFDSINIRIAKYNLLTYFILNRVYQWTRGMLSSFIINKIRTRRM